MPVSERKGAEMDRKLIIDGNAVYEIDEKCMLRKQLEEKKGQEQTKEDVENLNEYKMKRAE